VGFPLRAKAAKLPTLPRFSDVRRIYRDAEAVGNFTIFNLKGNDFRLIVGIDYGDQVVYYKYLLTHAEYDKDKWKNDPYF
jgi:mRNA interferase HigB